MSNGFIKCTLQLERIISLEMVFEKAMAIKVIQENSAKRKDERSNFHFKEKKIDLLFIKITKIKKNKRK